MKRIGLTDVELEALENAIVEYGAVVTFDQLFGFFDEDRAYFRKRISKLARQGWLKRIKRGVYIISDLSSLGALPISHYTVTNLLVEEAYLSIEGALQYHGRYDQLLASFSAVALKQYKDTTIDGITFSFVKTQPAYFYGWQTNQVEGQAVKIARTGKALIDLIQYHRSRYSVDLVLEKLNDYNTEIDSAALIDLAIRAPLAVQRILGFLLDCAGIDTEHLLSALADKRDVARITNADNSVYNHKWRLYYDRYFSKYAG